MMCKPSLIARSDLSSLCEPRKHCQPAASATKLQLASYPSTVEAQTGVCISLAGRLQWIVDLFPAPALLFYPHPSRHAGYEHVGPPAKKAFCSRAVLRRSRTSYQLLPVGTIESRRLAHDAWQTMLLLLLFTCCRR